MLRRIDPQAAAREGYIEVLCGRCGRLLAHQTPNGKELIPNDSGVRVMTGRVGLKCGCGGITEWRSSSGGTNRGKNRDNSRRT